MRITVLGAAGATGRRVVEQLLAHGHTVHGTVRTAAQADGLRRKDVETAIVDLAAPTPSFVDAFRESEAVVNTAATRSMNKREAELIDHHGIVAAVDAAVTAGVKRWVQLSMWGTADPSRLPGYLRDTARAKLAADDRLGHSGLNWTVVRPPWLTDNAPTGLVTVGDEVEEGSLSRDDLAAVLVTALDNPATFHRAFEVTGGGRPISDALDSLTDR
ncbi:NAD(P)H-binding protein [Streptomyces sp. DSM 40750]|uniref:NAD(P)H-binding protein n=1 Tax=Streptomyces sp. DSM 40750 TaxID=2801030 RepID=UPI00214AD644|nr:NAD(P)H-binding protein [Streptomyces sp. DSM 40750]UUU22366.1 NAD(P)H-binding protein [Streptomyces sp. DSM 40750]